MFYSPSPSFCFLALKSSVTTVSSPVLFSPQSNPTCLNIAAANFSIMYFYTVFMHIRSSHCPGLNPLLCSSILCHEECSSKYCMLLWCNIDVNNKRNPSSALVILMFVLHFSFSKITSAEFVDGQQREAQLNEGKMKHLSTLFHIAQCDARNQSH